MTTIMAGNPSGYAIYGYLGVGHGGWVDLTPWSTRNVGIPITRAGLSEPQTTSFTLWAAGGGLYIPDFMRVRIIDPYMTNPTWPLSTTGLYVRYFNGFMLRQRPTIVASVVQQVVCECVGWDWLWKNPPARPEAPITVGQAPIWQPNHTYALTDMVVAFPDVGEQYQCTQAGISGATQPAGFEGSPGHTGIIDNTCLWAAAGPSAVTDLQVFAQLLPIYYPDGQLTYDTGGTGNMKNLIAAVPSMVVTTDMTMDDVFKKVSSLAGSRTYFATYPARAAGHHYDLNDQIEQSPSVHGIVWKCSQAGTTGSGGAPAALTTTTTLGVTVTDGGVHWVSYRFTGRWEPSITMTLGQRVEPDPVNGYWYQVTTPGTTGASEGLPWSTALGTRFTNGTVTLQVMGIVAIQPVWQAWTLSDDFPHTASWVPDAAWFDAVADAQIIIGAYTDDTSAFTSDDAHYAELVDNREGDPHVNRWYVAGLNDAFARVDNVTDHDTIGMWISQYYSDQSDTGPRDNDEVHELGTRLNAASITRETIQITATKVLDPVMIQKLSIANVTTALLGISQDYQASQVTVTLGLGAPIWAINFGAGFSSGQTDPLEIVLGRPYNIDNIPPALVGWPTDWVQTNSYDCAWSTATFGFNWLESSADTAYFDGYYRLAGEDLGHWFARIFYPATWTTLVSLPPNTGITIYMSATDHFGNVRRNPDGTIQYSVSPTVTTAARPPAPDPPVVSLITQSFDGSYHLHVTVDKAHPGDDGSRGGDVKIRNGAILTHVPIPIGSTYPVTVISGPVDESVTYHVSAEIVNACGDSSGFGTEVSYTVTPEILGPPTSLTEASNVWYDPNFTVLDWTWVAPVDPDGLGISGYHFFLSQPGYDAYEANIGVVLHMDLMLHAGLPYTFSISAIDGYGRHGASATISGTAASKPVFGVPGSFVEATNEYSPPDDRSRVVWTWAAPTPVSGLSVVGYDFKLTQNGVEVKTHLGNVLTVLMLLIPGIAYTAQICAVDQYQYEGAFATHSGTAASRVWDELPNPSFENIEQIITPRIPKGYTFNNRSGNVTWDATTAHDGTYSVELQWPSGPNSPQIISDLFRVQELDTYAMDFYFRSEAAGAWGVGVTFEWYDSSFSFLGSHSAATTGTNATIAWQYMPLLEDFQVPVNVRYAQLFIEYHGTLGHDVWIDQMRFRPQGENILLVPAAKTYNFLATFDGQGSPLAVALTPAEQVPAGAVISEAHLYTDHGDNVAATVELWFNATQWPLHSDLILTESVSGDHHDDTGLAIPVTAGGWMRAKLTSVVTTSSTNNQLTLAVTLVKS